MRAILALSLAIGLSLAAVTNAGDKKKEYQVGSFMGDTVQADGTYTSNVQCLGDSTVTCKGSSGFNGYRVYFVKTDEGTWQFIPKVEADDSTFRQVMGQEPVHFKKEKPNLLENLKPGDKVAFRIERDHRLGGGKSCYVFIPHADDPSKEDKFVGFIVEPPKPVAPKSTNNVTALCDAGKLSGAVCEKPAPTAGVSKPSEQPTSNGTDDPVCAAFIKGYAATSGTKELPDDLKARFCSGVK
jgi:hypothetical protein